MMKEITVVMPVYKVEKYVSECLDSIINQTFDCFECIIIDDCSPDNSMRLIEEKLAGYKGNISFRIVRNERNEGVSAARNKGIELSRGGYLFFIDSDDMLYENCLEKLWEETKRHPGIDTTVYKSKQSLAFYRPLVMSGNIRHSKIRHTLLQFTDQTVQLFPFLCDPTVDNANLTMSQPVFPVYHFLLPGIIIRLGNFKSAINQFFTSAMDDLEHQRISSIQ